MLTSLVRTSEMFVDTTLHKELVRRRAEYHVQDELILALLLGMSLQKAGDVPGLFRAETPDSARVGSPQSVVVTDRSTRVFGRRRLRNHLLQLLVEVILDMRRRFRPARLAGCLANIYQHRFGGSHRRVNPAIGTRFGIRLRRFVHMWMHCNRNRISRLQMKFDLKDGTH